MRIQHYHIYRWNAHYGFDELHYVYAIIMMVLVLPLTSPPQVGCVPSRSWYCSAGMSSTDQTWALPQRPVESAVSTSCRTGSSKQPSPLLSALLPSGTVPTPHVLSLMLAEAGCHHACILGYGQGEGWHCPWHIPG